MKNKQLGLFFMAFILVTGLSSFAQASMGLLPARHKEKVNYYPVGGQRNGLTPDEFTQIMNSVFKAYSPEFQAKGLTFIPQYFWNSSIFNAVAFKDGPGNNNARVLIFGGLAREPNLTADGILLVACHEIGHHLGGIPSYPADAPGQQYPMAVEGQSDYFATLKCLRRIYSNMDYEAYLKTLARAQFPQQYLKDIQYMVKTCQSVYSNRRDMAVCIRSSMAGFNVASLFGAYELAEAQEVFKQTGERIPILHPVLFSRPDRSVVPFVNPIHPVAQCRLDTFFAGAICNKVSQQQLMSYRSVDEGVCSQRKGDKIGFRPRCWFSETPTPWEYLKAMESKEKQKDDEKISDFMDKVDPLKTSYDRKIYQQLERMNTKVSF